VSNETILLVIKFKIGGSLRFLSHAETVKVFQRACVRAGIKVQYSCGFNPRPKLSLPLPRSVAVESDDDLLCLRVNRDPSELRSTDYESRVRTMLSSQLPEDLELVSVTIAKANEAFRPCLATYVLKVKPDYLNEKLRARIKDVLASECIILKRTIYTKKTKSKDLDVRGFLKNIELDNGVIVVECRISSAGSIRVDEILKLLQLDMEKLAAPVRRTNVQWQSN